MNNRRSKLVKLINPSGIAALSSYLAFISWRLFFYAYTDNYRSQMTKISFNLVPFKTMANYIKNTGKIDFDIWIYNLAGNVAAFLPLGFLLPLAFKHLRGVKTYIITFIIIVILETMQLISRRGVFDVDDILLNMLGSILGYIFYWLVFIKCNYRR